jgi:hypothetical protein
MEQDLPVTAAPIVTEHSYTETITEVTTSASIGISEKHHSNEADAHSDISATPHPPLDQAIVGASQSTYEIQVQPFSPDHRRTTATKVLSTDEDLDSVEAEASWGFDIEEAIDIETQVVEQRNVPLEQEHSEQVDTLRQQYRKSVITQESSEHIISLKGGQELFMEDASIRAIKDEHRVGQESDNEHDTEVREVCSRDNDPGACAPSKVAQRFRCIDVFVINYTNRSLEPFTPTYSTTKTMATRLASLLW